MQRPTENQHTVELNGDQNIQLFRANHSKVTNIRLVVHTGGAWQNSQMSENHVSIYLILEEGGSVRINMTTGDGDTMGILVWSQLAYQHSNSTLWHQDYPAGPALQVAEVYRCVRDVWGLHRYQFSPGGSGCRFWAYNLLYRMAEMQWVHTDVPTHAWQHLSTQYSRSGETRHIEIRPGQFLSRHEWYDMWTEDCEE